MDGAVKLANWIAKCESSSGFWREAKKKRGREATLFRISPSTPITSPWDAIFSSTGMQLVFP
jgi:hypothetical protein